MKSKSMHPKKYATYCKLFEVLSVASILPALCVAQVYAQTISIPPSPFTPNAPIMTDLASQPPISLPAQTAPIPSPKRFLNFLTGSYAADQILVKFKSTTSNAMLLDVLNRRHLSEFSSLPALGWHILSIPSGSDVIALRNLLANETAVEEVSLNAIISPGATPSDFYFPGYQWPLFSNKMGMEAAWDRTIGNPNFIIAVCDSGITEDHEDLVNKITRNGSGLLGYNSVTHSSDPAQFADDNGHGTFVSGIAAAQTSFPGDGTNPVGIAGVSPLSKILPIKITHDSQAHSTDAEEAAGISYAASVSGVKVINISYQGNQPLPATYSAIQQATKAGILVVSIMGNINIGEVNPGKVFPGAYWEAMSVSATNYYDVRTFYSNTYSNAELQNSVAAPSGDPNNVLVTSTSLPGAPGYGSGLYNDSGEDTSFSAPHVAGLASIVLDEFPSMTWSDLKWHIEDTATNVNNAPGGRSDDLGWGRVNGDTATASHSLWTSNFPAAVSHGQFASLPVWPSKTLLDPIDRSQDLARLFPGTNVTTVYWWSPTLASWLDYSNPQVPRFGVGRGYAIKFPAASSITYTGAYAFQNPYHPAVIHLLDNGQGQSAWNIIGTPGINPIQWNINTARVRYPSADGTAVEVTLSDPSAATYIQINSLNRYDPGTGTYIPVPNGGQLTPGEGYFIEANKECDLLLPNQ